MPAIHFDVAVLGRVLMQDSVFRLRCSRQVAQCTSEWRGCVFFGNACFGCLDIAYAIEVWRVESVEDLLNCGTRFQRAQLWIVDHVHIDKG